MLQSLEHLDQPPTQSPTAQSTFLFTEAVMHRSAFTHSVWSHALLVLPRVVRSSSAYASATDTEKHCAVCMRTSWRFHTGRPSRRTSKCAPSPQSWFPSSTPAQPWNVWYLPCSGYTSFEFACANTPLP